MPFMLGPRRALLTGKRALVASVASPVTATYQAVGFQTNSTAVSVTLPSDITVDIPNGIKPRLILLWHNSSISSGGTVTDTAGNTYSKITSVSSAGTNGLIGCAYLDPTTTIPAGTVITWAAGGSANKAVRVYVVQNADSSKAPVFGSGSEGTSTAPGSSVAITNANTAVFSMTNVVGSSTDVLTHDAAFSDPRVTAFSGWPGRANSAVNLTPAVGTLTKLDSLPNSWAWLQALLKVEGY